MSWTDQFVAGSRALATISCSFCVVMLASCGPKVAPAPSMQLDVTDEVLVARGRYVVEHVAACVGCHTQRNPTDHAELLAPRFSGGNVLSDELEDFPGKLVSSNLTPHKETGLGAWTDGEIMRAIREGVNKEEETLFPMMPYGNYRTMSDNDAKAVVAYLKTLEPAPRPNPHAQTDIDFPVSFFINFAPTPVEGVVPDPPLDDPVARGKYLVTLGSCNDCHSAMSKGSPVEGRQWAGGVVAKLADGSEVVTSNITPDEETGIGAYTYEDFVTLMRTGVKRNGAPIAINFMPWSEYKGMTDKDLQDMWAYLKTLPPVRLDIQDPEQLVPFGG